MVSRVATSHIYEKETVLEVGSAICGAYLRAGRGHDVG